MSDFEASVRQAYVEEIAPGVDRSFARKFFTDLPLRTIQQHTGEAPVVEKTSAMVAFLGSPAALLCFAILSIYLTAFRAFQRLCTNTVFHPRR